MMEQVIAMVAVLACTLFTGAAVYITAVEHPARLSCGVEAAVAEWAPSYKRATVIRPLGWDLVSNMLRTHAGRHIAVGRGSACAQWCCSRAVRTGINESHGCGEDRKPYS
jgi:hypothetical protein